MSHFVYSFINRWTVGFPFVTLMSKASMNIVHQVWCVHVFLFLQCKSASGRTVICFPCVQWSDLHFEGITLPARWEQTVEWAPSRCRETCQTIVWSGWERMAAQTRVGAAEVLRSGQVLGIFHKEPVEFLFSERRWGYKGKSRDFGLIAQKDGAAIRRDGKGVRGEVRNSFRCAVGDVH